LQAAVKTNKKAMAYLALAFENMRLLRWVSKAKSDEWPEGEAWKVMQSLTKKYLPHELQARVELRKMPVEDEEEMNKIVKKDGAEEELYYELE